MDAVQIPMDEFDVEYGVPYLETTNTSEVGFTDRFGDGWETWPSKKPGVEFNARRQRDGKTVEVMSIA